MQEEFLTYSVPKLIGQVADTSLAQIDSYVSELDLLNDENIEFGAPVMRGTDSSKQVKNLDNKDKFLGIAVRNDARYEGHYPANTMVSVMTFGRVVVTTTTAVVAGDVAYVHATGKINKTATDGTAIGVFASNTSANELAILEIK